MPHYFMNIREHGKVMKDEEGSDHPDLAAARKEAQESAREIIADTIRARKPVDGRKIEITDERGTVLESVVLRDILD